MTIFDLDALDGDGDIIVPEGAFFEYQPKRQEPVPIPPHVQRALEAKHREFAIGYRERERRRDRERRRKRGD